MPGDGAAEIVRRLRGAGHQAFWVGGCVRDIVRGREPADYDIATSARPEEVRALFPRTIPVGERFGICLVVDGDQTYEVAAFRTEADYDDGRRPSSVSFATAEEDVRRRDFTINGLMMNPETGEVIDHVGGLRDIERRIIRTIGDPDERFAEDHLRMLRAVRFSATLDFEIETETFASIQRLAAMITRISAERIRDELCRLLTGGAARHGLELLSESGLLFQILPEIDALKGVRQPPAFHPEGDVWEHTLRMVALLPRPDGEADLRLAWAALLHDVGKAVTRSEDDTGTHFYGHVQRGEEIAAAILRRLRFSREEMETILALVRCHMLFMNVREMRPNRLKRLLRMPDFDLHLELHRLDCIGSHGLLDHYEFCKQKLEEYPEEELRPPRLLTGQELIAMGFAPGPLFKAILGAVEDAQLGGEIADAAGARNLVLARWGDPKRKPGLLFRGIFILVLLVAGCGRPAVRQESPYPPPTAKAAERKELQRLAYTIQAGAFSSAENAARLTLSLQQKGLEATYFVARKGLYKVRFGNFPTREQARIRAEELRNSGLIEEFYIVSPEEYAVAKRESLGDAYIREELVRNARSFLDVPYLWGGTSADTGFDCSGLTMTVYQLSGFDLPRTSRDQFSAGSPVERSSLAKGDLLFFAGAGGKVSHVGIYAGEDLFIHSPGKGKRIRMDSLAKGQFSRHFVGARSYL